MLVGVSAGTVDFSILFSDVTVEEGAEICDSILMPGSVVKAGANIFVVGSAIFGKSDPEAVCREFVKLVEGKK